MENELERRFATAKERLIGAFEIQGQSFTDPDFHGCRFISAARKAVREHGPTGVRNLPPLDTRAVLRPGPTGRGRVIQALAQQLVLLFVAPRSARG